MIFFRRIILTSLHQSSGTCIEVAVVRPGSCFFAGLTNEKLKSENRAILFVNTVYQRDALFVFSEAFEEFNALLSTRRGQS